MGLRILLFLVATLLCGCAFQQPRAEYTPANAEGNECMNQCLIMAYTGKGCGEYCDSVLDSCYSRCEQFHGGEHVPLAEQRKEIEKSNDGGFIRKDRFQDD